ncbi:MAG: DUF488 domain-containing protein [Candidatus Electrothrix sp. AR5]|nr:DUF488 domain-containing protein [Candidatus Electrothrix sp. AR5]
MIYRQKVLLALMQELENIINEDNLQVLLFLFCHEFVDNNHYYDFIPTSDSPISIQAQEDKRFILSKNIKKRTALELDFFEKMGISKLKKYAEGLTKTELLKRIYEQYPYYKNPASNNNKTVLYTIGYEGISVEKYVNTLIKEGIVLLCDVRKNAYSQKFGFSKNELKHTLQLGGIEYLHIPELGIESDKRQGFVSYQKLFDEYEKTTLIENKDKLDYLATLLAKYNRIAITCFEKDVYSCHRSRIAKAVKNMGYDVGHL